MIQAKITTIGNSVGIILPKEALAKLKVQKGDSIYLSETAEGYNLSAYDKEFIAQMTVAEQIMHDDKDVLRALSKR